MSKLVRINGQKNNIYYVEVYPNETIADIIIILSKKYNRDMSNFTIGDKPVEDTTKISDLTSSIENGILTFDVTEQQSDPKNTQTNDNSLSTSKQKIDKKMDPKIESLVDLFQFKIGLSVSKDKIIEALRGDFKGALSTDSDKKERIKALEYLINTENSRASSKEISNYPNKDQKILKKIQKKTGLPFCIVAYVYDGNSHDKDKTSKILNEFISEELDT